MKEAVDNRTPLGLISHPEVTSEWMTFALVPVGYIYLTKEAVITVYHDSICTHIR